jgi:hypothetical protein
MPPRLNKRLSAIARKRGVKKSELVRDLIEESLLVEELGLPELTPEERRILDTIS